MKKVLKLVTCSILGVLLLSGCGEKPPTAEELVFSQIENKENFHYLQVDMLFDLSSKVESVSMNMEMNMNADMKMDDDTLFLDGSVAMKMMGMEFEQGIKQYSQKDDYEVTTYKYSSDDDCWTYSVEDSDDSGNGFDSIKKDMFKDLVLVEGSKEDEFYKVTGILEFNESFGLDEGILEDSDVDFSDAEFEVTMLFDKGTKCLTDIDMVLVPDSVEAGDEVKINEMSICCKVMPVEEDFEVKVPKDVMKNSVPEVSGFEDYFYGDGESEVDLDDLGTVLDEEGYISDDLNFED